MPTWDSRLPFIGSSGRTQIQRRFDACNGSISRGLRLSAEQLAQAKMLGCGNYGCTYLVPGLPSDRNVLKITSDNLEAHVVNFLVSRRNDPTPPGIVHYEGIWLLGKCSVLSDMQPFLYPKTISHPQYGYKMPGPLVAWVGEGAPYRPVWLIQREELPDVDKWLRRLRVTKKDARHTMDKLYVYATQLFEDAGVLEAKRIHKRVPYSEIKSMMDAIQGQAILDALDWLVHRKIAFVDFKLENLGWREGVGLAIRDMGFSHNEADLEPPATLDGFLGR